MTTMSPHLPYAFNDDDEFQHPSEGWLLIDRTIVFDSWILWRHALPIDRPGRMMLHARAATLITALAERLHTIHLRMPGYGDLGDTPFVFNRWWNPHSDDESSDGSCCVFRIKGQTSEAITNAFHDARVGNLTLTALSGELMRAQLTHTDPASLGQGAHLGERPQKRGRRRTPQSPPAGTDGPLPAGPPPGLL